MTPLPSIGSWTLRAAERKDPRGTWHRAEGPRQKRARALLVDAAGFRTPAGREAFRAEAARAVVLHIAGAVPVLEAGVDQDRPYAILPMEEGEGLDAVLAAGPLSWPDWFVLARCLLAVTDAAAREGVSLGHLRTRDVRQAAAGWTVEGWGISGVAALQAAGGSVEEMKILLAGQPEYAAPDLLRPGRWEPHAVDQYALGALLYHAATGRAPFAGGSPAEVMNKHRFGLLDDPMDVRPDCPPAVSAWLERMVSRLPEHRYPSLRAAAEALDAAAAGRMSGVQPMAAGLSAIRRSQRRDVAIAAVSLPPSAGDVAREARRIVVNPVSGPSAGENLQRSRRDASGFRIFVWMLFIVGGLAGSWWHFGGTHGLPPFPWPPQPLIPAGPETLAPLETPATGAAQPERDVEPSPPAPIRAPAPVAPKPATPAAPVRVPTTPPPAPAARPPTSPAPTGTGLSRISGFTASEKAFNEGVRIFDEYRAARAWVAGLDRVPGLMESAARGFESCQRSATPEEIIRLKKYVDQSYRLAMAARQAILMHQDEAPAGTGFISRESGASVSPPSRPRLPPPPAVIPARDKLQLARGWNLAPLGPDPAARDLRTLLRGKGTAGVRVDPDATIEFMPGVPYLCASPVAVEGLKLGARRQGSPLDFTAYPPNSFTVVEYPAEGEGEFETVRLVVDAFDHVVAVQWSSDRTVDHGWLPAALLDAARWSAYDFVSGSVKPAPDLRVGHRVRTRPGMVQIDTELTDPSGQRSLGRQILLLPQPVVNILLQRMGP